MYTRLWFWPNPTDDISLVTVDEASVGLLLAMVGLRLPLPPQWLEMFAGGWWQISGVWCMFEYVKGGPGVVLLC